MVLNPALRAPQNPPVLSHRRQKLRSRISWKRDRFHRAVERLAATLHALHALPPVSKRINYLDALDGFIRRFQAPQIHPERENRTSGLSADWVRLRSTQWVPTLAARRVTGRIVEPDSAHSRSRH